MRKKVPAFPVLLVVLLVAIFLSPYLCVIFNAQAD